jgi:hypothetical protein
MLIKSNIDMMSKLADISEKIIKNESLLIKITEKIDLISFFKNMYFIFPQFCSNVIFMMRRQISLKILNGLGKDEKYQKELINLKQFFVENENSGYINSINQWLKILDLFSKSYSNNEIFLEMREMCSGLNNIQFLDEFSFMASAIIKYFNHFFNDLKLDIKLFKTSKDENIFEFIIDCFLKVENVNNSNLFKVMNPDFMNLLEKIYVKLSKLYLEHSLDFIFSIEQKEEKNIGELIEKYSIVLSSTIIKNINFFLAFCEAINNKISIKVKFINEKSNNPRIYTIFIFQVVTSAKELIIKIKGEKNLEKKFFSKYYFVFAQLIYILKQTLYPEFDIEHEKTFRKIIVDDFQKLWKTELLTREEIIKIINSSVWWKENLLPFIFNDVKYCLYCNYEIEENTIICPNCNKEIEEHEQIEFNLNSIMDLASIENSYSNTNQHIGTDQINQDFS